MPGQKKRFLALHFMDVMPWWPMWSSSDNRLRSNFGTSGSSFMRTRSLAVYKSSRMDQNSCRCCAIDSLWAGILLWWVYAKVAVLLINACMFTNSVKLDYFVWSCVDIILDVSDATAVTGWWGYHSGRCIWCIILATRNCDYFKVVDESSFTNVSDSWVCYFFKLTVVEDRRKRLVIDS